MPETKSFHNYERQYALLLNRINPEKYPIEIKSTHGYQRRPYQLTDANRKIIDRYKINLENEGGSSFARRKRILHLMANLGEMLAKDFEGATKEDIEELVSKVMNNPDWNETTKSMHKQTLKSFYKWLQGNNEFFPPQVRWIRCLKTANSNKLPEEMLTEEEVQKVIQAADHPMKRSLISLLWETGARVGEIGNSKIRSIQFDGTEATVMLDGKTGMRQVLLVSTVPFLKEWLSIHPLKNDKNAPLFVIVSNIHRGQCLSYASICRMLTETVKKAAISKPFNPHHWRHSRATYLAGRLTESQLCKVMGWRIGSKMPATYIHLSGRDTNEAIRKIYGLGKKDKEEESKLKPRNCNICGETNEFTNLLCKKCNNPLTLEARLEYKDKLTQMQEENVQIRNVLNSMVGAMNKLNAKMEHITPADAKTILEENMRVR